MADDSLPIVQPIPFHPCDIPTGMLGYNLELLTSQQQRSLNCLKEKIRRENEQYLAAHPQIRALIVLLLRDVLKKMPRGNIREHAARFFARAEDDIQEEMLDYIEARHPHVYEGDSAVDLRRDELESISSVKFPSKMSVLAETGDLKEELAYLERIPLDMLNEIIAATLRRLHIDVDDQTEDLFVDQEQVATEIPRPIFMEEEKHEEEEEEVVEEEEAIPDKATEVRSGDLLARSWLSELVSSIESEVVSPDKLVRKSAEGAISSILLEVLQKVARESLTTPEEEGQQIEKYVKEFLEAHLERRLESLDLIKEA